MSANAGTPRRLSAIPATVRAASGLSAVRKFRQAAPPDSATIERRHHRGQPIRRPSGNLNA